MITCVPGPLCPADNMCPVADWAALGLSQTSDPKTWSLIHHQRLACWWHNNLWYQCTSVPVLGGDITTFVQIYQGYHSVPVHQKYLYYRHVYHYWFLSVWPWTLERKSCNKIVCFYSNQYLFWWSLFVMLKAFHRSMSGFILGLVANI